MTLQSIQLHYVDEETRSSIYNLPSNVTELVRSNIQNHFLLDEFKIQSTDWSQSLNIFNIDLNTEKRNVILVCVRYSRRDQENDLLEKSLHDLEKYKNCAILYMFCKDGDSVLDAQVSDKLYEKAKEQFSMFVYGTFHYPTESKYTLEHKNLNRVSLYNVATRLNEFILLSDIETEEESENASQFRLYYARNKNIEFYKPHVVGNFNFIISKKSELKEYINEIEAFEFQNNRIRKVDKHKSLLVLYFSISERPSIEHDLVPFLQQYEKYDIEKVLILCDWADDMIPMVFLREEDLKKYETTRPLVNHILRLHINSLQQKSAHLYQIDESNGYNSQTIQRVTDIIKYKLDHTPIESDSEITGKNENTVYMKLTKEIYKKSKHIPLLNKTPEDIFQEMTEEATKSMKVYEWYTVEGTKQKIVGKQNTWRLSFDLSKLSKEDFKTVKRLCMLYNHNTY